MWRSSSRRAAAEAMSFLTRLQGAPQGASKQKSLTYGGLKLKPLTGALGAEVTGVQLKGRLSDGDKDNVRQAFLDHSVLVFRGQANLSGDDMLEIAAIFGEPEDRPVVKAQYGLSKVHELVREAGTPGRYGEVWHHDCSYMKEPPLGAMLYGVEVPPYGNDTVFASMYEALDSISPKLYKLLEQLKGVHSAFKIVSKDPNAEYLPYDDVEHPVVRTHPESGRPALFVNQFFTKRFVGMTVEESQGLLELLVSLAKRPELQCRVRWEPETLTIWDNRCTQHTAVRDNTEHRRVMRRVEIRGDKPF